MNPASSPQQEKEITIIEKIIALVKGELMGKVLTEKEYYYLMFHCETDDDIKLIKSMTMDECGYYLDCCWYFGIEHTAEYQLDFMKIYRKFSRPDTTRRSERDTMLDALLGDLEFLPSSEDSKGIVWIAFRDVRDMINARKANTPGESKCPN